LNISNDSCYLTSPLDSDNPTRVFLSQFHAKCILMVITDTELTWVHSPKDLITDSICPIGMVKTSYEFLKAIMVNGSLSIRFDGWDTNPWVLIFPRMLLSFYTIEALFIFICFIMAVWKVRRLNLDDRFGLNIASVCLCLEIINSILRLIYIGVLVQTTFLESSYRSGMLLNSKCSAIYYFAFFLNLSSGIFVIYFWRNMTSLQLPQGKLLDKSFWSVIVLVCCCFILLLIGTIINVIYMNSLILSYIVAFILLLCFLLSIFYFIIAKRVYDYNNESRAGSEELHIMTMNIVLSGVVYILITIISIVLMCKKFTTNISIWYYTSKKPSNCITFKTKFK